MSVLKLKQNGKWVPISVGAQGIQGPAGANGEDGENGITPHIDETTKHWMIGNTDTGIVAEGTQGATGPHGITPTIGENENWYLGNVDTGKPSRGRQGEKGEKGDTGAKGEKGDSGVYVGAGDMPEGYNVQIDPSGSGDEIVTAENIESALGYTPADSAALSGKQDKPIIKTAMDEIAVAGAQYYLGEQTAVDIVFPDDAQIGQMITFCWYNGATAATLSITGTMLAFDYTPSANTRSEINALWDGTYWAVLGNEMAVVADA